MNPGCRILEGKDIALQVNGNSFALDVLTGLSETRKKLPSKYFYDDYGSRLFNRIMELPEYYLTNAEMEILHRNSAELCTLFSDGAFFNLVELGPGDGRKTRILLDYLMANNMRFRYIPIDISTAYLNQLTDSLRGIYPQLDILGLACDYFHGLKWLSSTGKDRNVVLFLGSNVGNFSIAETRYFLRNLWDALLPDDQLLIGFDLRKDISVLTRAYNDSEGITAEFNLNLLRRINNELGGRFDLSKFKHHSSYDVFSGAIESYLISLADQSVFIEAIGSTFRFHEWEPIHTEFSYKYFEKDIKTLAGGVGFDIIKQFYDSRNYFTDSLWKVKKSTIRE